MNESQNMMKKIYPIVLGMTRATLIVALFGIVSLSSAMAADLFGFVIGVDDYQSQVPLEGAVNDARDIASALKGAGAKEVVLLLDGAADRDTVFAKWHELISHTQKGDVLVFSYAGHGSQEPEHNKGNESDGRDENFLLASFQTEGKDTVQRIVDDEIAYMLKNDAANLHVLFVADSCHSGTMTRSISNAPKRIKNRSVPAISLKNDALRTLYGFRGQKSSPAPSSTRGDEEKIPNVFGISAVSDHELVPEITADDGKQRAALSVAVAKALRGEADTNKDTFVSKEEMERFVSENVRMMVDGQQHPQFYGGENFSFPLTREAKAKPVAEKMDAKPDKTPVSINLFVTNISKNVAESQWRPLLNPQIHIVENVQQAHVIWNMSEEKISSQLGDELYDGKQAKIQSARRAFSRASSSAVPNIDLSYAIKVFDKIIVVENIKKRSEMASPVITLSPNDRVHRDGEQVVLETSNQMYPFLTLFNISSEGTINNLYPINDGNLNDPLQIPNQPYALTLKVEPPFGADHFVMILSDQALVGLHDGLKKMDGKKMSDQVEAALDRHLKGVKYQIGIHGVFTGP